jgi:ubiquinone biosynthesis protein COQ9
MTDPALIEAAVRHAGTEGWTRETLRHALAEVGEPPEMETSAFPRGVVGAIEAWCRLADSRMEAAAAAEDFTGLRTPQRVRRVVELRLRAVEDQREALRGATALLALPWNLPVALRCTARTVSAMWYAAGDRSADFSWYTRRATLAAVYTATLAFWLSPRAPGMEEALAFLDRRLADLAPRKRAA